MLDITFDNLREDLPARTTQKPSLERARAATAPKPDVAPVMMQIGRRLPDVLPGADDVNGGKGETAQ